MAACVSRPQLSGRHTVQPLLLLLALVRTWLSRLRLLLPSRLIRCGCHGCRGGCRRLRSACGCSACRCSVCRLLLLRGAPVLRPPVQGRI